MKPRRRIAVVDLVARAPTRAVYARVMNANLAGIMPQAVAVWCERLGHQVDFVCYTGLEDLAKELPASADLVFIGAFTQSAQLAYALSNLFRSRGAVTALGGPHSRCYPRDSARYFDYVLGFTGEAEVRAVIEDCSPHRPEGVYLTAARQPTRLPGVRERWKFASATLRKAPLFQVVPMLGSLGCPYTCAFCIDAEIPYSPLDPRQIRDDLRFVAGAMRRPRVSWHDPNFGVRFEEVMAAIEQAAPPGSIQFVAESSLSLLGESHLERLRRNGFLAVLPGIESWYDLGGKSRTGTLTGLEKVRHVANHVNQILRYVPYVQTNFVLGLDGEEGAEPFELTKRFLDLAPGAFPGYSLLSAFGQASPINAQYRREGRILPFPFHFLNNNYAMNVRPSGYGWPAFYDRLIDLTRYSFSWPVMARRFQAGMTQLPKWMNVLRGVSSEGFGRLRFYREIRSRLDSDRPFRRYFEQETAELPSFYVDRVRRDLGRLWEWLPAGALIHDPTAVSPTALTRL